MLPAFLHRVSYNEEARSRTSSRPGGHAGATRAAALPAFNPDLSNTGVMMTSMNFLMIVLLIGIISIIDIIIMIVIVIIIVLIVIVIAIIGICY